MSLGTPHQRHKHDFGSTFMIARHLQACSARRLLTTKAPAPWPQLPVLPDSSVETFRDLAFAPAQPYLFPRGHFANLPATNKWFSPADEESEMGGKGLDTAYLLRFGDTYVPLEISTAASREIDETRGSAGKLPRPGFARAEHPLSSFLHFISQKRSQSPSGTCAGASGPGTPSIYLAQCPLPSLPPQMQLDVPTPQHVRTAGRGHLYDSSIWMGLPPTYTPLHKDPNPNVFAQLAGEKVIRIFEPAVGAEVYREVRRRLGGDGSGAIRGEEMMVGPEREMLDAAVWGKGPMAVGYEAVLEAGDGIFVPKGWWHSVKGLGRGINGSVCVLVMGLSCVC